MQKILSVVAAVSAFLIFGGCCKPAYCPSAPFSKLEASVHDATLLVKLTNSGDKPIFVDSELVFMVCVTPVDQNGQTIVTEEESLVPTIDKKSVKTRFIRLQPGTSLERIIDLKKPFQEFVWAYSDKMKNSAYERMAAIPKNMSVTELRISYGVGFLLKEALESYLGEWPKDLYDEQLTCSVPIEKKKDDL